jgi:phosphoribosylformylglycinamidine synthase
MLTLPGSQALSEFRLTRLLARLAEHAPALVSLGAQYQYLIDAARTLAAPECSRLETLLDDGGQRPARAVQRAAGVELESTLLVLPRPGTISPWSSKATDIAHVCGLGVIQRIERGILFRTGIAGRRRAPGCADGRAA